MKISLNGGTSWLAQPQSAQLWLTLLIVKINSLPIGLVWGKSAEYASHTHIILSLYCSFCNHLKLKPELKGTWLGHTQMEMLPIWVHSTQPTRKYFKMLRDSTWLKAKTYAPLSSWNSTHMKVFQNVKIMIEGTTDWYAEYYYHKFVAVLVRSSHLFDHYSLWKWMHEHTETVQCVMRTRN